MNPFDRINWIRNEIRFLNSSGLAAANNVDLDGVLADLQAIEEYFEKALPARAQCSDDISWSDPARKEEWGNLFANRCLDKLIQDYCFNSVLDVGGGRGRHAKIFNENGKSVAVVDILDFGLSEIGVEFIQEDFRYFETERKFDCVWCSHVLEHQHNPQNFLTKLHDLLKEGGVLAITVPPLKDAIVGGHVTLWNAGLVLYQLALAGFDCSEARILAYGYNISVIVEKRSIAREISELGLRFDAGDIKKLSAFLPSPFRQEGFDGNIAEYNWR